MEDMSIEKLGSEVRTALAALEIMDKLKTLTVTDGSGNPIQARIGLHSGPVVAGVIGTERLQYDVWGDTVNVASRLEGSSEPGRNHVSEHFANALTEWQNKIADAKGAIQSEGEEVVQISDELQAQIASIVVVKRGETDLKGKGSMVTYWLERK